MEKKKQYKPMTNKKHSWKSLLFPRDRIAEIDREQKKASAELERIIREIYEESSKG